MEEANASPLVVPLLFLLRCLVPLAVLLGISYLFKKLGLIKEPPPPPPDFRNGENNTHHLSADEGGRSHGNP